MIWLLYSLISLAPYSSPIKISTQELEENISANLMRVSVFELVKAEAEKMGIRVFLAGGTAAGFGFYSAWDLRSKKGDINFDRERFDYEYSTIYRSTQDADFAIDGTPDQAAYLEEFLRNKANFLAGGKVKWEVGMLHHPRGFKPALLNDFDFIHQHTDSASVGLIELTNPPNGQSRVRDLRFFDAAVPPFLQGLAENKVFFYFGTRHEETRRFQLGLNPAISSVLRYLIKSAQFETEIDELDRPVMQEIIDKFDPAVARSSPSWQSFLRWFHGNGAKPFLQSINVEYAANLLDSFKVREKFIEVGDDWVSRWLDREPLRSRPVGEGDGKTAAQLGLSIVSHETSDFKYYEAITSNPRGKLNAFTSRQKTRFGGESASCGDGFYVRSGKEGAAGTGLTIRMKLKPAAREGTDFLSDWHGYFRILNPDAVDVLYESLTMTPLEFLSALTSLHFDRSDLGILLRFRRRVVTKDWNIEIDLSQKAEASSKIKELLKRDRKDGRYSILFLFEDIWSQRLSGTYSEILDGIPAIKKLFEQVRAEFYLEEEIHAGIVDMVSHVFDFNFSLELIRQLIIKSDRVALRAFAKDVFSKPESFQFNNELAAVVNHSEIDEMVVSDLVEYAFSKNFHQDKINLLEPIFKKYLSARVAIKIIEFFLRPSDSGFEQRAALILDRLDNHPDPIVQVALARHFYSKVNSPEYLQRIPKVFSRLGPLYQRWFFKAVQEHLVNLGQFQILKEFGKSSDPVTRVMVRSISKLNCKNELVALGAQPQKESQ